MTTTSNKPSFNDELASLINRHSRENESNTPDFILAEYMGQCLATFNHFVNRREEWYGRESAAQKRLAAMGWKPPQT